MLLWRGEDSFELASGCEGSDKPALLTGLDLRLLSFPLTLLNILGDELGKGCTDIRG
jgi:hypothetical protein